ncbi:MAG: methylaspartate mutase [Candidatus Dadabacteria bacterium]|nr:MAG: methylaspartate mutase [Candidatus Dadabacteria bacterium]
MKTRPEELNTVLVTDCGSTTTKALLFQRTEDGWRQTCRGEAPTTVEAPVADVTVGALNAFREVEELSGRPILKDSDKDGSPFEETTDQPSRGIDLYLSTSSAGGGLQMMVAGVVSQMTTESAERAALGAGAIVLDAISADDRREVHERIERIRHLRPDIVLLTGGVDGGSRTHVVEMAEVILAASPRPRFGDTLKLPVIYAGNRDAADEVREILDKIAQVSVVENVRPTLERENLGPAREAIHEFFLTHVMSHSPGYGKLLSWTPVPVMPTPAAVGDMVQQFAAKHDLQVLCVDIGGATTDVFSVFKNDQGEAVFNRTVSANLGMSYSIANVLLEAGIDAIARWLPYSMDHHEIRDRLRNKMIRPTSIPQTIEDLMLEQAVCREALRLSLKHHRSLAVGLSGVQQQRGIADIFSQKTSRYELVDMRGLDVVIGSGGVLSHAPNRLSAALMMLDGFGLEGVTQIAVDSIFMMPHLGVFASVYPDAADEIFVEDCLINIAHSIVPVYRERKNMNLTLARVWVDNNLVGEVVKDSVSVIELGEGMQLTLRVEPLEKHIDVGAGAGKVLEKTIESGMLGLILDGRNRPIAVKENQVAYQKELLTGLNLI